MATNKVVYNGKTLIDLTGDTVTASTLVEGITAHNKVGNVVTGTIINTGKGKYVWGKYRAVPAITKTDTKSDKVPSGYTNSTTYNTCYITDDGYFKLGTIGMDTYLLPNGATNGKTKKIAYKQYGAYNNHYYIWTLGDEKTKKGTLLGYVSSDDSSAYPDDGIQDNYYYVKLSASSSSSGGSTSTGTNTSDATATAANILSGKTAYISSGKTTGTMTNNGAVTGTISTKTGTYTIPSGYHSGSGKVSISSTEQNKIIASNIKSGISILGVTGTYTGDSSSSTSSNNNCEAYLIDVTNPTVSFKTTSGTIKAYGYATATSSSSWGTSTTTMYAFNGTSYYKSVTYETPSATSITLGVSNGKLTGLPDLTSGTLLVTRGI